MRVYLRTFGCRANHYDSEAARAMLERAGHEVVASAAEADAALFNSCAVTAQAEADLRKAVRRAARERDGLVSVIMGCASGLEAHAGGDSLRALPGVRAVVPGADLALVAAALGITTVGTSDEQMLTSVQSGARALLRIQDGCDEHCTFCATTLARGASRSRPTATLVDEARALAARHAEIVLTGVHIGSYGADFGASLGMLVERLVHELPSVRFRLSSLEATEVDARLFELLTGDAARVAPYLHAPLQSGSDRMLRRMGRHWYTAASYAAAVERLAAASPVFGLGADVITGFPTETEDDHRRTVELVERLPFTYLHVFPFSPRPGTSAERLASPVPAGEAGRRAAELRELAAHKADAYRRRRAGTKADVVVVRGGHAERGREGLTEDYLTVRPGDPSPGRGARFRAVLTMESHELVAVPEGRALLAPAPSVLLPPTTPETSA